MNRRGDAQREELIALQRRERKDAGGLIQVWATRDADIKALLQRLRAPIREERRVEGSVRMIEYFQPIFSGGGADLQVEWIEGIVGV